MAPQSPDDGDRPATRRELDQSLQAVEAVLRTDIAELRVETAEGFAAAATNRAALRGEMAEGFAAAATDRAALRGEMAEGFAAAATDRAALRVEMAQGHAAVEKRVSDQTRVLIGSVAALLAMQAAVLGVVLSRS